MGGVSASGWLSGWGEGWWQPGAGGEELLQGLEFVSPPCGGGVEVGVDDGEVGESFEGAPGAA
jgi:hypothetical protein